MGFFEWWSDQSPWLRYGVALLLIGISTVHYLLTNRIWMWGWIAGGVLLLFAGPSDSEKNGYRF